MSLFSRIPNEFYKLFTSKYTEYYMAFLVAIYNAMDQSYSVLGLTEKECRAVMNERIASAAILWDDETYDEDGVFLTRSNMASVCLKHFEEWGWLKQDYDETLNSHVVTFPEYSQMYVELFARLMDEGDSQERKDLDSRSIHSNHPFVTKNENDHDHDDRDYGHIGKDRQSTIIIDGDVDHLDILLSAIGHCERDQICSCRWEGMLE